MQMIEYRHGDILQADAEALVNTVNCVGIMGRGVALQFKNSYPKNFKAYEAACRSGDVQPGRMFVFETGQLTNPKFIINFPTKRHWRGKSRMEDIEAGLEALASEIQTRRIRSIALPPLGSGLGGLVWRDVRSRIEKALKPLNGVRVLVYEPHDDPATRGSVKSRAVPTMTIGRAALVALMTGISPGFWTLSYLCSKFTSSCTSCKRLGRTSACNFQRASTDPTLKT